ncbi:hypothetical protein VP01_5160g2 [Puccinia sorghi]|uniref:Uncharacterized protein n=1 Tax=Puccinia sorghi TaxID=27349 RepID=A0A0L6UKY0_9BASI|nr:hypothetical protein VP01_5160g2 [Puccinia sorghi]
MLAKGLQLSSSDQCASKCARCFGPRCNQVKAQNKEPNIILALDRKFQQRHYAYTSKDKTCDDQYPPNFIKPLKITTDAWNVQDTEISAQGVDATHLEYYTIWDAILRIT